MNIIDACAATPSGFLYVLCDDGSILVQERVSDLAYQNVPPSLRPEFTWRRLPGPDAAVFTRLITKGQDILVVADNILWERVRDRADPSDMHIPVWIWRPVALPEDEPASSLKPVSLPSDTFEAQRAAAQLPQNDLVAENAALRQVIAELTAQKEQSK